MSSTYLTLLIALREAAKSIDPKGYAAVCDAFDKRTVQHAEQHDMFETLSAVSTKHKYDANHRAAAARSAEATDLAAAAWKFHTHRLPTLEESGVIVERTTLLSSAFEFMFSELDTEVREQLRVALRCVAFAHPSEGVEEAARWLLDDCDSQESWEAEMDAMNQSFADGTWTVNCDVCDIEVHHSKARYNDDGFWCEAHAPEGAEVCE